MAKRIVKRLRAKPVQTVMTTAGQGSLTFDLPDLFIEADISTNDGVQKVIEGVLARLGGLDILVNNVGGSSAPSGGALALSDADWQQTFNINLFAAVRLDRAFLPKMLEQNFRRHYSYLSISALSRLRCDVGLCGSKRRRSPITVKGYIERSRTQRKCGEYGWRGFHRKGSGCGPDQKIGQNAGHRSLNTGQAATDGFTRRHSHRTHRAPRGSC